MNSRNTLSRNAEKKSSGWIFSPRPVTSAGWFWRKNGTSEPSAAASSFSFAAGSGWPEQFVQREQRGRSIAATATQSGGEWNFFLQMNANTPLIFAACKNRWRRGERDCANPPARPLRCMKVRAAPPRRSKRQAGRKG